MKQGRFRRSYDGPFDVAFFVGRINDERLVALGGTAHHLIGSVGQRPWSNSGVATLMEALKTESVRVRGIIQDDVKGLPGAWTAEAHDVWDTHPGPEEQLEFLAVKLAHDSDFYDVLLGSPIYVARDPGPRPPTTERKSWWHR
jgi:hypothetical protein